MDLSAVGDAGRAKGKLPASDYGLGNCDGDASAVSDAAVVEEIGGVGFEIVGVENPSPNGDRDPELMFFIAFSVKRNESAIVGAAKLKERAGNRYQRRRLIVVAVESSESPVETGNVDRNSEAWADGALAHSSRKMGWANAGGQSQPRNWFEFVIQEESRQAARRMLVIGER